MLKRIVLFNLLWLSNVCAEDLQIRTQHELITLDMTIASDPTTKDKGFMYRKSLKPSEAMLFLFDPPQVARMWMKNTFISLDMLFINEQGKIIHIHQRAKPESLDAITYAKPVKAVVEIAAGESEKLGILVGDRVVHPLFSTQ